MAEEMDTQEEVKPRKSASKFLILAIIVIVLGAGGYVGWSFFMKGKDQEKKEETPISKSNSTSKKDEMRIVFPLESFVVNLADKTGLGKRYLKVTVALEVNEEKKKKRVEEHTAELRDTILLLLSRTFLADMKPGSTCSLARVQTFRAVSSPIEVLSDNSFAGVTARDSTVMKPAFSNFLTVSLETPFRTPSSNSSGIAIKMLDNNSEDKNETQVQDGER